MNYPGRMDSRQIWGLVRRTCSYVDPRLMEHGYRVAGLVRRMLEYRGGHGARQMRDICCLALLHDIGAYKTDEIARIVQFETVQVMDHSVYGYLFLRHFSPLGRLAPAVLYHHTPWNRLAGVQESIREIAQLIHLADRVDVCLYHLHDDWNTCLKKLRNINAFSPQVLELAPLLEPAAVGAEDRSWEGALELPYTREEISAYLQLLVYAIDFRSPHTVTHTITTSSISRELALCLGMNGVEVEELVCGAILHDLGKIGIPVEILEYPGKLSPRDMAVMRTHVKLTEEIFAGQIDGGVARIALRHHEKLDGSGYPRGLTANELTASQRLVAVADIVSALSGARSYKEAYSRERVVGILRAMRDDGLIDRQIVNVFIAHYDAIMARTQERCRPVLASYEALQREYAELMGRLA